MSFLRLNRRSSRTSLLQIFKQINAEIQPSENPYIIDALKDNTIFNASIRTHDVIFQITSTNSQGLINCRKLEFNVNDLADDAGRKQISSMLSRI